MLFLGYDPCWLPGLGTYLMQSFQGVNQSSQHECFDFGLGDIIALLLGVNVARAFRSDMTLLEFVEASLY